MKKIFAMLTVICLLVSVLSITVFATEAPAQGVVLRISALNKDGTAAAIENGDFKDFAAGWEAAIDYAQAHSYARIIVDFYADWNANAEGEFGDSSGDGFQFSTIYIPDDVRITLNLNGHTINRNLKEYEYDGEVIYIDEDADVIINNGTVTGGWSCNGAGGIHIHDADVTLNNVNVIGNKVDDDDGAGIALYDEAELTMNGGCVSHNLSYNAVCGGGVYVHKSIASFTDVSFRDNQGIHRSTHGAAIYVDKGTLVMSGCDIVGNGLTKASTGEACSVAYSIIDISNGSEVALKETTFSENGYGKETAVNLNTTKYTTVINSVASYLTMEKCSLKANHQVYLIQSEATVCNALDSDFTGNNSFAFYGNCARGFNSAFTRCKFSYNEPMLSLKDTFCFNTSDAGLSFVDCQLGNATFNSKSAARFVDTDTQNRAGSIFGEGSLTMIVAILALIASGISICLTVGYNKKKTVPTAVAHTGNEE